MKTFKSLTIATLMKKSYFIFIALFMAILFSCSSGGDSKKITPTSTEFTSGELAKYIEVVDQPSELTYAEKDGAIETQYIRLKVTLRMTKDGLKNVDARDIDFTSLLSVAVINLVDENGSEIQDLSIKDEDILKLKKLLTGSEGDTEEIIFEGEYHNSDDAPKWFKQASQFTPYLTGDISVEGSSSDDEVSNDTTEALEETSSTNEIFSDTDSHDWDELLDSYDDYVTKYISFAKKASQGDMAAMAEYPALLEKAQEFNNKMQGAQSDMSPSQWSRYIKITTRMTQAMQ